MPRSPAQARLKTTEVPCLARWLSQPVVHPRFAASVGVVSLLTLAGGAPLGAESLLMIVAVALCTLPHSSPPAARAWCRATQLKLGERARAHGARVDPPIAQGASSFALPTLGQHPNSTEFVSGLNASIGKSRSTTGLGTDDPGQLGEAWQHWVGQAERALVAGRGSDYRFALYRLGLVADRWADLKLMAGVRRVAHQQYATEATPEAQRWLLLQLRRLDAERLEANPV